MSNNGDITMKALSQGIKDNMKQQLQTKGG
jgi:hypothetical protein